MLTPIHNPALGKLRVIGYTSGSGETLWKAYELQKEMEQTAEGCPFEIVGVFCSKADSKVEETAKELGIPSACIDIRAFCDERGKPLKDREVLAEYDAAALELIRPMKGDVILLADYAWETTDCLMEEYLMINVHLAELLNQGEIGHRYYDNENSLEDALKNGKTNLCSASYLVTKQINDGPILAISERVSVDYSLHDDNQLRVRHYLKLVNNQRSLVGTRTLLEIAAGNFQMDESGAVYYKGEKKPMGIHIENWEENKPIHQRNMDKLLYPNSVAIVGASNRPGIGNSIISNLLRDGYKGEVFAVNVRGEDVASAKGYTSISDIPDEVDLAVIATPSRTVLEIAEACGQKGVGAIVCITAGFKEVGGAGIEAEQELMKICNRYNMRLIGPNCMGEMNAKVDFNITILHSSVVKGNVALVTQSGAIGAALLDYAGELGIGFSSIVSLGNQADVNVCDLLPCYEEDEHTKVIVLYLESILEPTRFWQVASKITKPILLLKSGSSEAGMAAASSHTGSLAGDDQVVDALIRKAGIMRVSSVEECFLCAAALSQMPRLKGNRVAIVTNAGGPGTLITDATSNAGFDLPTPSEKLGTYLREHLMAEASTGNPIDLVATAPPAHYALTAKAMMESGEYDALLICCIPPATINTAEVATTLLPVLKNAPIPVLTNFFGPTLGAGARELMVANKIPTSEYPEQMAMMLAGMREVKKTTAPLQTRVPRQSTTRAKEILQTVPSGEYLPVMETYELLEIFGIHGAAASIVKSVDEVQELALTFPVVAKIEHPEIVHKSDVGGVRLNIQSSEELETVVEDFLTRFSGADGVFVQEMLPGGIELIIGSVQDPAMGSAIMVGLGGVWVEVMKDVIFGYPPLSQEEAMNMINTLKIEPLLAGYRGKPGVDKEALANLMEQVSRMLLELPEIGELDLNPILFHPEKGTFIAADARIRKHCCLHVD